LGGPISKGRGGVTRGGEKGEEGRGKEMAMSPPPVFGGSLRLW